MARKKYCNEVERIKSDKFQLKRFTSKTEHLLDKIEKLEVRKGLYKIGENEVPENSLALYISLNPCSIKKATISLTKSLIDIITSGDYTNLEQLALSSIHKSKSRVIFVDADIDTPDIFYNKVEFHNNYVKNKLPIDCYNVLKTKGGYHIHVNVNKVSTNLDFAKLWYKNLSSIKASDMISSDMLFSNSWMHSRKFCTLLFRVEKTFLKKLGFN